MQHSAFRIRSRFNPAYSVLGLWIRERVDDPRRAASLHIVIAGVIALALVLAQILSWTFLDPSPVRFAVAQGTATALYFLLCLAGREPEINIEVWDRGIEITRRASVLPWRFHHQFETETVPFRRIRDIRTVPANLYYTHYARYAGTRAFVNRIPPEVLMLDLEEGPLFLGLDPADVDRFLRLVREREAAPSPRVV